MPSALTIVRKAFVATRLAWPLVRPTTDHPIDPIVNTTKPQPVTRAPRLEAVMIAATAVAIGASQPAASPSIAEPVTSCAPRAASATSHRALHLASNEETTRHAD